MKHRKDFEKTSQSNKSTSIYNQDTLSSFAKHREQYESESRKVIMTLDKNGNHYFIPNESQINERNEFLHTKRVERKLNERLYSFKPTINPISKKLIKEKHKHKAPDIDAVNFIFIIRIMRKELKLLGSHLIN